MRRPVLACLLAFAPLLASCASGPAPSQIAGLSPEQAVAKACKASLAAGGATVASNFQLVQGVRGSMAATFDGAMSEGTIRLSKAGKTGQADELGTAQAMYLRGDKTFWKLFLTGLVVPDKVLSAMDAKWLRVNAKGSGSGVRKVLLQAGDPQVLLGSCPKGSAVSSAGGGEVEGQAVKRFAGEGPTGAKVALAVSNAGDPYVLDLASMRASTKTTSGLISVNARYSNYGATLDVHEPKPNYDLSPLLSTLAALTLNGTSLG